jgi:plastocyanin
LSSRASQVLAGVYLAAAETIIITVGDNSTDGTTTFDPPRVDAVVGDTVVFNFTSGNHTAIQSTFSSPCIPAHDTDVTINGFDSGFRNTTPGTSGTILSVPILEQNQNETFWFYDFNTCGQGGVGAINNNESSTETLAGFVRNAIRLNGTNSSDTSSGISSRKPSSVTSTSSVPTSTSAAERAFAIGTVGVIPLFIASLFV